MNEVSYSSIRDQARYYLDRFGIDLAQSGVTITELTDISATRNLLVHNNGVVNSLYLETVPHSTCKLGDTINLTIPDVEKVGRKLRVVSSFLHKVIVKKFSTQPLDRQTP
jgi:hypothetical protein